MEHIITSIKGPVLALASKFDAKQEDTMSFMTHMNMCNISLALY